VSDTITLQIDRLAAGGDGVARHDGMAVFVPRAVPGDTVRVTLHMHRRFARGQVVEWLARSPDRVEAPCAHFTADSCGGCQWQELSYAAQLRAKATVIADAVTRIAKQQSDVVPVHPSPRALRYRNALTLTVQRRGAPSAAPVVGLHVAGRPGNVFPLRECLLAADDVMQAWHRLMAVAHRLPHAETLRVTMRRLDAPQTMGLHVEGAVRWPSRIVEALMVEVPAVRAVWWTPHDGARRLLRDARDVATPGASFAQVNPEVARMLASHVHTLIAQRAESHVVDAYAGSGALAVDLARAGTRVTAIELDPDGCDAATAALTALGANAALGTVVCGKVETDLDAALPASLVVLNPPRAGVHERVTATLATASATTRIIYVSCDPATLARDIARLGARWVVKDLTGFDMFPQTAHVETVCLLEAA
jgi:23S rRNA (uracil1939-C5)-methyltransferase